jgi:hypothetical protein
MTSDVLKIKFTNRELSQELYDNVISQIFPNLIFSEKELLADGLSKMIDIIAISFDFMIDK